MNDFYDFREKKKYFIHIFWYILLGFWSKII